MARWSWQAGEGVSNKCDSRAVPVLMHSEPMRNMWAVCRSEEGRPDIGRRPRGWLMRRWLAGSLGSLLVVSGLRAEDVEWRATTPIARSTSQLPVRPVKAEETGPAEAAPAVKPAFAEDMVWKKPAHLNLKRPLPATSQP